MGSGESDESFIYALDWGSEKPSCSCISSRFTGRLIMYRMVCSRKSGTQNQRTFRNIKKARADKTAEHKMISAKA